jgi:D-ribose pyranase
MAEEFKKENTEETINRFQSAMNSIPLTFEPHKDFKKRVPGAIGLIRTGETIQYANMILESA